MIEKWPEADKKLIDKKAEKEFRELQKIISKIRNIRSSYHIDPARIIEAYSKKIENNEIVERLAKINVIPGEKSGTIKIASSYLSLCLDIANVLDVGKEIKKLKVEIIGAEKSIKNSISLMNNKGFVKNASDMVKQRTLAGIAYNEEELKKKKELLKSLETL
jgi:valyl-tRNA synthetase